VTVTITNPDGKTSTATDTANQYTYTAGAAPTITKVSPNQGPTSGGTLVTVTGTNISSNATVSVGSVTLDCDPASPRQNCAVLDTATFILITPGGPMGPTPLSVTNADGLSVTTSTPATEFTYGTNVPPSITGLSATTGPATGSTYVTIYGSDFGSSPQVKFG